MKGFYFAIFISFAGMAHSQFSETATKWNLQGDFYLQNTMFETTVGSNQVLKSTNFGSQILLERSVSKALALNLSTSAEHRWVLDGHTFVSRTIGLGFSLNNGSSYGDGVTLAPNTGFFGYYRFLHEVKAPEGTTELKPDNGVFGFGVRLGFSVQSNRFYFGPVVNIGVDFNEI